MDPILQSNTHAKRANVANFYSIIAPRTYTSGLGLGELLIHYAVNVLKDQCNTFTTISPIPKLTQFYPYCTSNYKQLAKEYLLTRHNHQSLCRVANFHLSNGAILHAIHENANTTPMGIKSSYGVMVNYLYDLEHLEMNKKKYNQGHIVHQLNTNK